MQTDGERQGSAPTRPPASRTPTMADVASHLGISRQLVSLVLRNQPGPSSRTRKRVLDAARELGYQPHLGAQGLRRSRSKQIGVGFVPSNFTEPDIVEAMYEIAGQVGYGIVLSAQTPHRNTEQVLNELLGYRCAGIITIGSTLSDEALEQQALRSAAPIVLVGSGSRNVAYDVIHSAGDVGIAQCVQHLVELGHRNIVYVDVTTIRPAPIRRAGFLAACQEHGLDPLIVESDEPFAEEGGAAAARRLLDHGGLPTAIVCTSDQVAMGAAMVLLRAGVRVPDDLSITGFDDTLLAGWSFFDLTSTRQDPAAMGRAAMAAILRRLADPQLLPEEHVIEPILIPRSSTAAPRGGVVLA